jgi:Asp-tRNA(Asn)/Glu-tRNA(Gln) amidotransferase C subunit
VAVVADVDAPDTGGAAAAAVGTAALRRDEPVDGLDRREALRNAPEQDEVFFLVPRVLGSD